MKAIHDYGSATAKAAMRIRPEGFPGESDRLHRSRIPRVTGASRARARAGGWPAPRQSDEPKVVRPLGHPPGEGMIRVSLDDCWHLMSPHLGGRDLEPAPAWHHGELSHVPIGGHRWFLQLKPVEDGFYPDASPLFELVARSFDGSLEVSLNSDPLLQPYVGPGGNGCHATCDRTQLRFAGTSHVSWLARRWDERGRLDDTANGLFIAPLVFDGEDRLLGAGEPTVAPLPTPLESDGNSGFGLQPSFCGYDWAPDGSALVYATDEEPEGYSKQLVWADPRSGDTIPILVSRGLSFHSPRWSPRGDAIVFSTFEGIESIGPDGSEWRVLAPRADCQYCSCPTWSPSGGTVAFGLTCLPRTTRVPTDRADIYAVPACGGEPINLTESIDAWVDSPHWE